MTSRLNALQAPNNMSGFLFVIEIGVHYLIGTFTARDSFIS